jgi:hypothetical protein
MTSLMRLAGAIVLALAVPAAAQDNQTPPPSPEEIAAMQLALDRGQLLHEYDQAAWHTTDAMNEDIDPGASGVNGWVVTPRNDGWLVTYWKRDGNGFAGVYSAVWTGRRVKDRAVLEGSAGRLSEGQVRQIRALQAVDVSGLARCADAPFNAVVIPNGEDGEILVYVMTPQTSANALPFGGHYRFTVRDGVVIEQRSFTRSCLNVALEGPEGSDELVAVTVSHLLDPVPTEVHVFSVFAARKPVFVATTANERVWVAEISGGQPRIRGVK